MSKTRLGIDIGGTFTDFTLLDDASGEVTVEKTLTTPHEPELAVFRGIDALAQRRPGFRVVLAGGVSPYVNKSKAADL